MATTPSSAQGTVACPECNAAYRWKPELAGKRIKCKGCGHVFAGSPPINDPTVARGVASGVGAHSGFVVPDRRFAKTVAADEEETTILHNWVLPGLALALGLALRWWQALHHAGRCESVSAVESLGLVFIEWIVIAIALAAGVAVGVAIGVEVERLGPGIFKPVAVALLMTAIANACSSLDRSAGDTWGILLGVPCIFVLAFFMFAAMFKADLLEGGLAAIITTVLVCAAMLVLASIVTGDAGRVLAFGRPA